TALQYRPDSDGAGGPAASPGLSSCAGGSFQAVPTIRKSATARGQPRRAEANLRGWAMEYRRRRIRYYRFKKITRRLPATTRQPWLCLKIDLASRAAFSVHNLVGNKSFGI